MRIVLVNTFLILFTLSVFGQTQKRLLQDPVGSEVAREAVHLVFNYEFEEAEKQILKFENLGYQDHPGSALLHALVINMRMMFELENKSFGSEFENYLSKAIDQGNAMMRADPDSEEATFFVMFGHSYLAFFYSELNQTSKAIGESKKAYKFLKKGFELQEQNPDFYLSSGLYNFYVEQYPIIRPIIKPLMSFFPPGNKTQGIAYLKEAYAKGTFTQPVALQYLQHVQMKYEKDYEAALPYGEIMVREYPGNYYFKSKYALNLLFLERYDEAKVIINGLKNSDQEYFQMIGMTLNGVYYEKHSKNFDIARNNYRKAKEIGLKNEALSYDYLGICYAGFARMLDAEGETGLAKDYYKKCLEYSEYTEIIEEAKAYLKEY